MANHDRFDELLSIYALGALDGEELREIESHLKTDCTLCKRSLEEMEKVLSMIPYSLPTALPSSGVKERLFKKIEALKGVKETPYRPAFWGRIQPFRLIGAVALCLSVLLIISNLFLRDRLREQNVEVSRLKQEVTHQSEVMEFLQNPNAIVVTLINLQSNSKAHGRVLWDKKHNKALFYGLDLPPVPPKKTYQLWVIANNNPVSVGIFKVDESGNSAVKLESLPDPDKIQKFAVTLEPEGGMPRPTGEMYLIGTS